MNPKRGPEENDSEQQPTRRRSYLHILRESKEYQAHSSPRDSIKQPWHQIQAPSTQFTDYNHKNHNAKRPRLGPLDPEDVTTPHPDQSYWSIDNLPSILYVLRPGSQYTKSRVRVRISEFKIFGKHVREFHILPHQISSRVEGWRLEAWWRLDRRIEAQDILGRINPKYEIDMLDLEMRREQFRRSFRVADWKSQSSVNEIVRLVKMAGIDPNLNTTRGLTPGLVDPSRGEGGGRIPVPAGKDKFVDFSGPKPLFAIPGLRGQRHAGSNSSSPVSNKAIGSPSEERAPGRMSIKPAMNSGQIPHQSISPIPFPGQLPGHTSPRRLVQNKRLEEWSKPIPMAPLQMRQNPTTSRRISTAPASYPETQCELASHHGTPIFQETGIGDSTMSLEEYLNKNHLSFEEYLCRDEDDPKEENDGRKGLKRRENGAVVTTPSKGNVVDPWLSVL